jgi:hypothetical protein
MRAVGWRARFIAVLLAALLGMVTVGPAAAEAGDGHAGHARRHLGVATYNLYLGADFTPLFTATSQEELVRRAGQVYANVVKTALGL